MFFCGELLTFLSESGMLTVFFLLLQQPFTNKPRFLAPSSWKVPCLSFCARSTVLAHGWSSKNVKTMHVSWKVHISGLLASFQLVFICIDGCLLAPKQTKNTVFFGFNQKKNGSKRFLWDFTSCDTKEAKSLQPNCSATVTVPPNLFWDCLCCYNNTHTSVRIFFIKRLTTPRPDAWN